MPLLLRKKKYGPVVSGAVNWVFSGHDSCIVRAIGIKFSEKILIPEKLTIMANDEYILVNENISQIDNIVFRELCCLCETDYLRITLPNTNGTTINGFVVIEL